MSQAGTVRAQLGKIWVKISCEGRGLGEVDVVHGEF
jgi:hypothetical protein